MPTDDVQIRAVGTAPAPFGYTLPGNGQIRPKAINVTFDGTGASGAFVPVVEFISDAGVVVARCPTTPAAAGASANVSWFPRVGGGTEIAGTLVSIATTTTTTDLNITATSSATAQTFITLPGLVFDGATTTRLEFFVAAAVVPANAVNHSLVGELWDNGVFVGILTQNNCQNVLKTVNPQYGTFVSTPSAGTHVWSIRYWVSPDNAITPQLLAHSGAGGYIPGFLSVIAFAK